jgi:hypothetical protein
LYVQFKDTNSWIGSESVYKYAEFTTDYGAAVVSALTEIKTCVAAPGGTPPAGEANADFTYYVYEIDVPAGHWNKLKLYTADHDVLSNDEDIHDQQNNHSEIIILELNDAVSSNPTCPGNLNIITMFKLYNKEGSWNNDQSISWWSYPWSQSAS